MKIVGGIGLLLIGVLALSFYMAGNHGQLMFRPHMKEDWVIWGIVTISVILGLYLTYRGIKTHKNG